MHRYCTRLLALSLAILIGFAAQDLSPAGDHAAAPAHEAMHAG